MQQGGVVRRQWEWFSGCGFPEQGSREIQVRVEVDLTRLDEVIQRVVGEVVERRARGVPRELQ